ncbi:MAG: GvpL/GvpF family gas vesicle protein [Candidatus Firestonebacteria bacterium]|nr:GvpL/GvpF family gas vesicle protein [Candidatus Firestonebacteria bacterium]
MSEFKAHPLVHSKISYVPADATKKSGKKTSENVQVISSQPLSGIGKNIGEKFNMENLLYLYCITLKEPDLEKADLSDDIFCIRHNDIYAVARLVSNDEFGETNIEKNLSDMEWLIPGVKAHMNINNLIMKNMTIVPFKFGTIFKTEESLKEMLDEYTPQFIDNIHKLNNKEEWAVKIYCNMDILNKKVSETSERIKQHDEEISCSGPGKAFLLKKKRDELIACEANKIVNDFIKYCFDKFGSQSHEAVINRLFTENANQHKYKMILNSAYLISQKNVNGFLDMIRVLKRENCETGFEFDYSGPWPPFNFVNMKEVQK